MRSFFVIWELECEQEQPEGPLVPRSMELEAPLSKRQLKHRRNRNSKIAKKAKSLEEEIDNLKSRLNSLKDKITKASKSTSAIFKRKKIRSMKHDADKISKKLAESETKLSKVPTTHKHPPARNKHIESKIAVLNKKIRRAKNNKNKKFVIAKRESLKAELNSKPEPRLLEGAFGGAYRKYRIDGNKTDPDTFFRIIRNLLIDMLRKESRTGAVRSQMTTWIRFRKGDELIELAFNSRMIT